jgi:hypothetical protein
MSKLLERMRVQIPATAILHTGKVRTFFDILPNNNGLTEEYLYTHQPAGRVRVPVYSTSKEPIGFLDDNPEVRTKFIVLEGPAILVARKGYGGRLSVIGQESFIVHEDGYAIRPKNGYHDAIDVTWFAGHYSAEFQAYRSSVEGIGDFPRAKLVAMNVIIPRLEWQTRCAGLYRQRDHILEFIKGAAETIGTSVDDILSLAPQSPQRSDDKGDLSAA